MADGVDNDSSVSSTQRALEAQRAQQAQSTQGSQSAQAEDKKREELASQASKDKNVQQWRGADQHDGDDVKPASGTDSSTPASTQPPMPSAPAASEPTGAVSDRLAASAVSHERRAGTSTAQAEAAKRYAAAATSKPQTKLDQEKAAAQKAIRDGSRDTKASPSDRRKTAAEKQRAGDIEKKLKAAGLPTRADGVPMRVSDTPSDNDPTKVSDHGESVVRSAAGKYGPGKGADISLEGVDPKGSPELAKKADAESSALADGRGGRDALVKHGETLAAQWVSKQQERVEGMRQWARSQPGDGTKLAVTSTGQNANDMATQAMAESLQGAADHPHGEAAKMWKEAGIDPTKVKQDKNGDLYSDSAKTQQALDKFRDSLAEDMTQKISSSPTVKAEQAKLEKSLKDGREQDKLLVFKSAGNGEQTGTEMGDAKIGRDFDNVKGFLTVAAIESKNGKDTIAPFSSSGNDNGIAAPGANMPVGVKPNGSLAPQDGTSFAAPYAMGVAGLMLKANPKLTPDQIESVMKETAKDVVPGRTLDGYGAVDVVRAVQRAKELAQ